MTYSQSVGSLIVFVVFRDRSVFQRYRRLEIFPMFSLKLGSNCCTFYAGPENGGPENRGPIISECKKVENAGLENGGREKQDQQLAQKMQQ